MPAAPCPNCRGPMEVLSLASQHYETQIDVCYGCHAFWFDNMESPGLSQASVLKLFQEIREHRDAPRQPIGARLDCPRCKGRLTRTQDLQGTNRIEYFRCTAGDGRFTPFYQFLREKRFVRSLSPKEMQQLRVQVSQVRCSSCGATVAIEKDAACRHCGAPVSILDADAMEKAVVRLQAGAASKPGGMEELRGRMNRKPLQRPALERAPTAYDLLDEAITAFADFFD